MTVKPTGHLTWKNASALIIALLALYLLVPSLSSFSGSFTTLRTGDIAFLGLGVLFWLVTFLAAALVYTRISSRLLSYKKTLLVQVATGFTNRLAPSGSGAIGLNVRYLIKNGNSPVQAGALVTVNNLLGFVGTAVLLAAVALVSPDSLTNALKNVRPPSAIMALIVIACLAIGLGFLAVFGAKLLGKIRRTAALMAEYVRHHPLRLVWALVASLSLTACYAAALYSVGLAFNVHMTLVQTFLVLTFGVASATITPTPGGLGGAEAGLVAALVAIGITPHQALTVALTYRFIVYWLPLLPGFVCFQIAWRRKYI